MNARKEKPTKAENDKWENKDTLKRSTKLKACSLKWQTSGKTDQEKKEKRWVTHKQSKGFKNKENTVINNKFENLYKTDKFLEKLNLQKLTHEEAENVTW